MICSSESDSLPHSLHFHCDCSATINEPAPVDGAPNFCESCTKRVAHKNLGMTSIIFEEKNSDVLFQQGLTTLYIFVLLQGQFYISPSKASSKDWINHNTRNHNTRKKIVQFVLDYVYEVEIGNSKFSTRTFSAICTEKSAMLSTLFEQVICF